MLRKAIVKEIAKYLFMTPAFIFPSFNIRNHHHICTSAWDGLKRRRQIPDILLNNQFTLLKAAILPVQADNVNSCFEFRDVDTMVSIYLIGAVTQFTQEIMHPDMGFPA